MTDFIIVQHGEKRPGLADPPLTTRGSAQAERTARYLCGQQIDRVISSPARRARETAAPLATYLALPLEIDRRLRERMEWADDGSPESFAQFLAEWERATADRDYRSRFGESSRAAGTRFLALLDAFAAAGPAAQIALFTHGGLTLDLLRTIFGDQRLEESRPGLFAVGPPGGAITQVRRVGEDYTLVALCSTAHLGGE